MTIHISRKVEFTPTPEEMAQVFADWNSDKQAQFFSSLADFVAKWKKPFCFQLEHLIDSEKLTTGGREIMIIIGEYGPASKD